MGALMSRRRAIAGMLLMAAGLLPAGAAAAEGYRIIVHPKNPEDAVKRAFLAAVFLRKATSWPNGDPVEPVDLPRASSVRAAFSGEVLGRTVAAVKSYWQQIIFSGRGLPPPELDSEEAVVRYVNEHLGGVGYVSQNVDIGAAKVVGVR